MKVQPLQYVPLWIMILFSVLICSHVCLNVVLPPLVEIQPQNRVDMLHN